MLVNCLLNAFAICVGEVIVFSLKVIVLFWVVLVLCWLIRVLSSKEYVCCVCDPSDCLGVSSMSDLCVCMRDVISECCALMFLCSILWYVFWK